MFELERNIGYENARTVGAHKSQDNFAEMQQEAWDMVKKAIDDGIPCYGWELEFPEYYVVNGYDDVGYYYSGNDTDSIKGPKPWRELGDTGIGELGIISIRRRQPADDSTTLKEALEFTLTHSAPGNRWTFSNYRTGLAGFDTWIDNTEKDRATIFGMSYNAAVWAECRDMGVKFLEEAKRRLNGNLTALLDEAIADYTSVAENLNALAELFPLSNDMAIIDSQRRDKSLKHLEKARGAEEKGLKALEKIVSAS